MANFTPIATGAAANAATVNSPLYELDAALTTLQANGGGNAARPWATIGSPTTQPTSSTAVLVTDDITHTGKLVRGATTITSINADMETRGNLAVGAGNHVMALNGNSLAVGAQNSVSGYSFASGQQNVVLGNSAAFGAQNTSAAQYSLMSGASQNIDGASTYATIAGGYNHDIFSGQYAGILAGNGNQINNGSGSAILTGSANLIQGASTYSAIVCGSSNNMFSASANSAIGGGSANLLGANYAFVGAGQSNQQRGNYALIGAGSQNFNTGTYAGIVSGQSNIIQVGLQGIDPASSSIVAGKTNKIADAQYSFIGAGGTNTVNFASYSAVVAGSINTIQTATFAFIGGGNTNSITSASNAFIGAGQNNSITGGASSGASIVAGYGNTVFGINSAILNGSNNVIQAGTAILCGLEGKITHDYAFMYNSSIASTFNSAAIGEFAVTAHGGVRIFTNTGRSTGMTLAAGASSWTAVSSAALKTNFKPVEQSIILAKLMTVPIQTYNFKNHDIVNLGPTAEDWDSAFADLLGKKTIQLDGAEIPAINEGDKLGVALAAIQALTMRVNELTAKLAN